MMEEISYFNDMKSLFYSTIIETGFYQNTSMELFIRQFNFIVKFLRLYVNTC